MWPFICQFVDKLFRESIEPAVAGANPHLSTFCFTKIDMGDKVRRLSRQNISRVSVCWLIRLDYIRFHRD